MTEFAPYVPLTDDKIRELATDIFQGKVFHEAMIRPGETANPFTVTFLLDEATVKHLRDNEAFLYEYMDQAAPRSINGMPCFLSFRWMSRADARRVMTMVKAMYDATREVPVPPAGS